MSWWSRSTAISLYKNHRTIYLPKQGVFPLRYKTQRVEDTLHRMARLYQYFSNLEHDKIIQFFAASSKINDKTSRKKLIFFHQNLDDELCSTFTLKN